MAPSNLTEPTDAAYRLPEQTDQGIKNLPVQKANELAGGDPDYSIRDLYDAIEDGNLPSWTLSIQVMTPEQVDSCGFNPFDLTRIWPHSQFPLIPVGKMVLDRNPNNYFAEVEQLAFSPANMPPGIEASPDKMLQVGVDWRTEQSVHSGAERAGSGLAALKFGLLCRLRLIS